LVILTTVVIYYSTVRLSQITIKNRAKSIAWIFIPVIFLAIFLTPTKTEADITNFTPFVCLFEKTTTNSLCPNINPASSDIKKGASSGVIYGKTEAEGITTTGIKTITMQLGLWMDVLREKPDDKYYYNRVADDKYETFILRIKYKKPGTEQLVYKLFNIPYQEGSIEVTGGRNPQERTITVDTANGGTVQNKIAFYKTGGDNGDYFIKQQVILAKVSLPEELPWNHSLTADFWYCGGLKDNDTDSGVDGRRAPRGGRVEYFTSDGKYEDENGEHSDGIPYGETKCDGTSYFQIGKTETFTLPISAEAAQADSKTNLESGITATEYTGSTLPLCSVTPWGDGSVMGCVAQILYHGVFRPVAFFAMLMGKLFDFFIGYSLSDESYRHDFIQTGWQLVRDISNIFFIIIMIYSGLAAVFSTSNTSYKKVIPTLIVNALIINFSLFATRIVIDMSNITARIFYNQMVVKVDGQEKKSSDTDTGFKPISEAIVSSFNPQKIFEGSVLSAEPTSQNEKDDETDVADFNSQSENQGSAGFKRYSKEYAGYFTLVTLVAIAISFSMAMMFWKTAFMFVGRVIGLYVAMIFSPFAFLSRGNVPLVNKIGSMNFSSWWGNLSKYALLAPIFVFFLYIINAFLNVEFFTKVGLDQNGQGFFGSVMYVVIPMLIIYGLVSRGVKIAESLAGEYGNMAQKFATGATGMVVGGALGIASGGLAYAGTRFGSRIGRALGRTSLGRRAAISVGRAASNGTRASLAARLTNRALNWTQNSSWDARNTRLGGLVRNNPIVNQMGLRPSDRVSGAIGLGQRDFEGGYIAQQERRQKELREEIENIKFTYLNDEQSKKLWKEISDAKVGNDAMKDYLNKTDTTFKASSDKETTLKKEVKDAQKKIDGLEADLKTNNKLSEAEMTSAKNNLKTEKENLANKQKEITDIQKLQLQTIENIASDKTKTNKIRETKEYQDSYKDKVNELQKTYGKIESSKDLTNAMRRDYAETLRNDSFWMKDGKQRSWVWTQGGALGGTLGAMISGGASAAFGAIASESIKFEQEALDAVTKKYIKDYGKGKGKTSKIDQYKNQLDELNKKLKEVVAAKKGISVDDVNLDDHDLKDQREWVKEHVENLKAEFDARDAEFKDATEAYRRSAKTDADKAAYASASKARKRAEDMAKAAENLWKNKSETEEKIKKEEDQTK
jgi:hypothetical protein